MTPLTPTQRDFYLHHVSHPESTQHLVGNSCRLSANLDPDLWLRAVATVLSLEAVTRTRLVDAGGSILQSVDERGNGFESIVVDLAADQQEVLSAEDFIERDRQRPFDLFRLPLWRTYLVRDRNGDYTAGLAAPHLFTDGWTMYGLFGRIALEYERLLGGATSPYETGNRRSFLDYAVDSQGVFDTPEIRQFWEKELAGLDPIGLPCGARAGRGREELSISSTELNDIRRYCRSRGWSFVALLRAVYAILIRRFTGTAGDLAVLDILDARPPGYRNVAGCFFQTVPILAEADAGRPSASIEDLIGAMETHRQAGEARRNVSSLTLKGLLPENSLNCYFNFYVFEAVRLLGEDRRLHTYTGYGEDEIHLVPSITRSGLSLKLDFPTHRFPSARFLSRYVHVIRQVVAGVSRLGELSLLLAGEETEIAPAAPQTAPAFVSPVIQARSKADPNAVAISCNGSSLSYGNLERKANRLANFLAARGVGQGSIVAILLPRSPDLVVAMLGVMKAGAAYLPLDPLNPAARLAGIVRDSGAVLLLTSASLPALPIDYDEVCIIRIDGAWCAFEAEPPEPPGVSYGSEDAAYVIYTSGSTGTPKGVVVTHGNLTALLDGALKFVDVTASDVWTMFHSAAFDFSVWEIFGALTTGGRLVIVPYEETQSPEAFYRLLHEENVTVLSQTPSAFLALSTWEERSPQALPLALRTVVFGGEALRFEALRPWIERHGESAPVLINMYGITETTVHVTAHRVTRGDIETAAGRSIIGRPIPGWSVTLRDPEGYPVPSGVPGEIYVGGRGIARGYLNRPALDAERFVVLPDRPEERLYRSGDLARVLANGDLEYLGRADLQVKIRGYRIELGEIEAALLNIAEVHQAAVVASEHAGDRRLVAYIVARPEAIPVERELRQQLAACLPAYMVPWRIITLTEFPRTANGKLDRNALPNADEGRADSEGTRAEILTPLESNIAAIWSDVLGLASVRAKDEFFELGGNSLLATQMMVRVRDRVGVPLPLCTAFQCRTVAALADAVEKARIDAGGTSTLPAEAAAPPPRPEGPAPLTFAQERAWFLEQLYPRNLAYHFVANLTWNGALNVNALSGALSELVRRHEVLRTTFEDAGGEPRQRVHAPWRIELTAENASPGNIAAWIKTEAARPFDLGTLPLIRWKLFRLDANTHQLVHVEHHLLHDGWSFALLLRELFAIYESRVRDRELSLPAAEWQASDVALRERQWIVTGQAESQLAYWTQTLGPIPKILELPADLPRPAVETFRGDAVRIRLDDALAARVEAYSRRKGATPHMTLRAVFEALIQRLTGSEQFVVGSGSANRGTPALELVVGMLLNNLALPADVRGEPSLDELLSRVQKTAVAALDNQEMPFDRVVKALNLDRSRDRSPLCQVFFSSYDGPVPNFGLKDVGVDVHFGLNNGSAKFDLNVIVVAMPVTSSAQSSDGAHSMPSRSIEMIWEYRTDLFLRETIERWSSWFVRILDAALSDPARPLRSMQLMAPEERERVLVTWNRTASAYPRDVPIHKVFEHMAEEVPEHAALSANGAIVTYRALNQRADEFAAQVLAKSAGAGARIGLCMRRSIDAIAAMIGILKAGGVYVPLDPDDPQLRRDLLIREASLDFVLDERGWTTLAGNRRTDAEPAGAAAYIMFTSGSTGPPKGVLVSHRNVVRLVCGSDYAKLGRSEILLQISPLTFDASTFEVWGALLNGGTLVLWPESGIDLATLGRVIESNRVTTLWLTASLLHVAVRENLKALAGIRQLLAGGDVLQPGDLIQLREAFPDLRIVNGYGPTEGTTFSCCHVVPAGPVPDRPVPIGRPIANTTAYVLDDRLEPVPIGVPGELFVGGDGVSMGYVNAPALTSERFLPDPWGASGGRLYRTGDRVRWRADGVLEFLGRMDRQVKIRGYRVEPAELERALQQLPNVSQAAVVVREDNYGAKSLAAFVSPAEPGKFSLDAARDQITRLLPRHMWPSEWHVLSTLPMTTAGKMDYQALALASAEKIQAIARSPETSTEKLLAEIWESVLGTTVLDAETDFFSIGGHSLAAIRVLALIKARTNVEVGAADLFANPRLSSLARAIERVKSPVASGDVQSLHIATLTERKSPNSALFVPGGWGDANEILVFAGLARHMKAPAAIFSVKSNLASAGFETPETLAQYAAAIASSWQAKQRAGRFVVIGECAASTVSIALAHELAARGCPPCALILLDPGELDFLRTIETRIRLARGGQPALIETLPLNVAKYYSLLAQVPDARIGVPLHIVLSAHFADIEKIRSSWQTLSSHVTVHPVPGDHDSYLRTQASFTAQMLDRILSTYFPQEG